MNDNIKMLSDGIKDALDDKKALDVTVLDITGISDIADCFVLATAGNPNQMDAMRDSVDEYMTKQDHPAKSIEGRVSIIWTDSGEEPKPDLILFRNRTYFPKECSIFDCFVISYGHSYKYPFIHERITKPWPRER